MTSPRTVLTGLVVLGVFAVGCGDGPTMTVTEADPDLTPGAATDDGAADDRTGDDG